ncbi:uncharacterized protein LOC125648113 [Ostrea edulis]|uniref:uncharacterized protein LOC125648113 n=1 Tax=Ostrea edulis TaxID=37623 RepID=UPI0024AEB100|nr:uncharacterized protein LOC125648113 [Ostrea edulis]
MENPSGLTITEMQTTDPVDSVPASIPEPACTSNCESNLTVPQADGIHENCEPAVSENVKSEPKRRKKVSMEELQKMQYEVLRCHKTHFELQTMKLKKEMDRDDMEKENLKLRNIKLSLKIECLKQNVSQNESAMFALQAINEI